MSHRSLTACTILLVAPWATFAQWPTHRGNAGRTGNVDGQPGPATPKVLWVHRSQEHFVASPTFTGQDVALPSLGAFNTSSLRSFALQGTAEVRWAKSAPYLKLPVVCAPAVADGLLVFGDGMHQTDGALLHGMESSTGMPLWQLPMPGKLVHLEGTPTIHDGRIYLGAGNAGVTCVDPRRVALDGKELASSEVKPLIAKKWQELQAKFAADKKRDPDFAVPPSEEQLPRPTPKIAWTQGKDQWHVDAPVAVTGDAVFVASARLDAEQVGQRGLWCLNVSDGSIRWQTPLHLNPWGGATMADDLVLVGCSSIRYDPKEIPGAKGEVVALDAKTGKEKWRKGYPGGVTSSVAVRGGMAFFTCTDGRVRALDVATGEEKWQFQGTPFFAGPAVATNALYVADLKGMLHALDPAKGTVLWRLDLGAAPVKAAGMVYGGPIVVQARLYVATCNLEGPNARKPTVVVCLGEK